MITEQPVIDHLHVELATAAAGVFRLDLSELDGSDLLAQNVEDAYTWTPLLPAARMVDIRRGLARDGVTLRSEVGRLTIELVDAFDPTTHPDVHPNARVRVLDDDGRALFTGTLEDVRIDDPKHGRPVTTLTAVDAVRDVANTPRYGAANPHGEHELVRERIMRLLQSSPVAWRVEPDAEGDAPLYRPTFPTADDAADEAAEWLPSATPTVHAGLHSVMLAQGGGRTITGLTPGRGYRVGINLTRAQGTVLVSVSGDSIVRSPRGTWTAVSVEFQAATSTATLLISLGHGPDPVYLAGITVLEIAPIYACNTVHESDLASHLDIATTTARTAWFVDAAGVLVVPPTYPSAAEHVAAHFADDGTGTHGYVGATVAYDTADLVSSVELQNHARQWDTEAGGWRADDRQLGPWIDPTARATLGARRGRLETTIADTGLPGAVSPEDLARAYLAEHSTPELIVRELRWNAAEDYSLAARLELWSLVDVTRRGTTHRMRVVALEHEITPTRWIINLALKKETT